MNDSHTTRSVVLIYSAALFLLLVSLYLLTYRGMPLSQDTYYIFDSAESLVRRGEFARTYEFSNPFRVPADGGAPWAISPQEPFNMVLVAPFFWLGQTLPTVGTMHVTWLFNIVLTALTAVGLFWGALWLRYSLRVAWLAALAFGVGTLAWTYSRFLFREPTMAFFVMVAAIAAFQVQGRWRRGESAWGALALCAVGFVGAIAAKEVSVVLLPGLLIMLLPPLRRRDALRGLLGLGAVFALIGAATLLISAVDDASARYDFLRRAAPIFDEYTIIIESVLGYQFSFSRSLWLHAPVLLVGLYGAWMLIKRGDWRLVAGPAVMVLALSAAYAGYTTSWWGNWGWGPRYMLPMIPVLMLWVLPVMASWRGTAGLRGARAWLFGGLVALGAAVQIIGTFVPMSNYYTDMFRAGLLPELRLQEQWGAYNWTWDASPLNYHLTRVELDIVDIAWQYASPRWLAPALIVGLLMLTGAYALYVYRNIPPLAHRGRHAVAVGVMALAIIGTTGVGLYTLREDGRYIEEWPDVFELSNQLDARAHRDQVIFIDREQYRHIFMNYFKTPAAVAILPYSPAEDYGDGPRVVSDDIVEQIGRAAHYAIDWASRDGREVWLVASSSPFDTDKIRPVERYLATRFYPVEEITVSERARAIRFFMLDSTADTAGQDIDITFGDAIRLARVRLPAGTIYRAGDVVPVTLEWMLDDAVDNNYNVSVQIAALDGFPLAQRDGQPQGTFGRFDVWTPETVYSDNHGIALPPDIAPGDYVIQLIVYRWQDGERLIYRGGGSSGDVLRLTTITIR